MSTAHRTFRMAIWVRARPDKGWVRNESLLDEIGELGTDKQAMLLRALEEKRFLPVGEEVASDFQLIAGTNRDVQANMKAGRFREDLLARLNVWTFALPGIAERREVSNRISTMSLTALLRVPAGGRR